MFLIERVRKRLSMRAKVILLVGFTAAVVTTFKRQRLDSELSPNKMIDRLNRWSEVKPENKENERIILEQRDETVDDRPSKQIKDNSLTRRLPGAHILGAMKSGTTTLHTFLGVHPDVVQADIAPLSYSGMYKYGLDWFLSQMPLSRPGQITMTRPGGFDPLSPGRADMYYRFNKDMKIIMILRDPALRAVSHFSMWRELNPIWRNKTIEEAIFKPNEPGTIDKDSAIIRMSLYYEGLLPFYRVFPMRQILIVDAARFITDPLAELYQLEAGLGLQHKLNSSVIYYDKERGYYCYVKHGVNQCMPRGKGRMHVELSESTREGLRRFYRPHNEKFFTLINRTFDWE